MLARLTVSTSRSLDVRIEQSAHSARRTDDQESSLIVELDALYSLLLPLPNSSWTRAAGACTRALTPLCSNLRSMISSDIDSVAQLLLDLETHVPEPLEAVLPVGLLAVSGAEPAAPARHADPPPRALRKRRRASHSNPPGPIVIPSPGAGVPSIVITLVPTQPRGAAAGVRVPFQDYAFGDRLTVPSHPVYNKTHSPMPPVPGPGSGVDAWRWRAGRWEVVLPGLEEQERRGLFSRPASVGRRRRARGGGGTGGDKKIAGGAM